MNSDGSNKLVSKFTPSGCKDNQISKFTPAGCNDMD